MIEEWKSIPGYEGLYEVSSYGRVRSLDSYTKVGYGSYRLHKGKVLSPATTPYGYLVVCLHCNGEKHQGKIHRLVAEAFIPNPYNLPEVNHKDEDKTNNIVENLEWCDRKYNVNYGTARIRARDTAIKNGSWSGLSRKEYMKKYNQDNKEYIKECKKKYYLDNKDDIKEYKKKYYQENTDKVKEYKKKWYQENKDKISDRQRSYYQENKDKIKDRVKEYRRKKEGRDTK